MNILRALKKSSVRFHRQAKQELKKKVAQKWCEGSLCLVAFHHFFFTHIKILMALEGYFWMEPSIVRHKKSSFISAKNAAPSSLWVGHQFESYIFVASNCFVKLKWVNYLHKVRETRTLIKNTWIGHSGKNHPTFVTFSKPSQKPFWFRNHFQRIKPIALQN